MLFLLDTALHLVHRKTSSHGSRVLSRLKEEDRKMGERSFFTGKQGGVQTQGRGQEDVGASCFTGNQGCVQTQGGGQEDGGASLIHREAGWCPDSRKMTGRWGSISASQGSRMVSRLMEEDFFKNINYTKLSRPNWSLFLSLYIGYRFYVFF